jgi:hypothetical protein
MCIWSRSSKTSTTGWRIAEDEEQIRAAVD